MTIYGITELSKSINLSRMTIYKYIRLGMPCRKFPTGKYAFEYEEVVAWLTGEMKEEEEKSCFLHASNTRENPKMNELIFDYGHEGYGMYWITLEVLRGQQDYKLENNKKSYRILAMEMSVEIEKVERFINDCIKEYKLFTTDGTYFWSNSLFKNARGIN